LQEFVFSSAFGKFIVIHASLPAISVMGELANLQLFVSAEFFMIFI
jgi:hypothetical protein